MQSTNPTLKTTRTLHGASHEQINFALSYPFIRPKKDFIYFDGQAFEINQIKGTNVKDWDINGLKHTPFEMDIAKAHPVIAVGSNGSPVQLRRKFLGKHKNVIPTITHKIHDHMAGYCRAICDYGSVPATITPSKGCISYLPVNFLDDDALEILNASESLGQYYELIKIENNDDKIPELTGKSFFYAYKSLEGVFEPAVDIFEAENLAVDKYNQWDIQNHVINTLNLDTDTLSFVAENIENSDLRKKRNEALQA